MYRCLFCENNLVDFIGHRTLYNDNKKKIINFTFFNQQQIFHTQESEFQQEESEIQEDEYEIIDQN